MISIVVPTFNRADLLPETLDSILAQTDSDWECLVVDDQSPERDVVETAKRYAEKDRRFRVFVRPDDRIKGAPTCRNIGYENSKGDLIYFFDSDDILSPGFFETIKKEMSGKPAAEFGVVPCDKFLQSPNRQVSRPFAFDMKKGTVQTQCLCLEMPVVTQNMIWRRSLLERAEMLWREGLKKGQDPDFGIRTVAIAKEGVWIDMKPMVHLRLHENQMATAALARREIGEVLIGNYVRLFHFIEDHGKMTPELRIRYFRGVVRRCLSTAIGYGNPMASKLGYELIRDHSKDLGGATYLKFKSWCLWKGTRFIHFAVFPLAKARNNPMIRWFKEIVWK